MTYEMVIAQAIHHLPPGYHVSIKNGNPCPKELLISTEAWPGEIAQYYHGTTAHNLLRGIVRDGLQPTFGSGGEGYSSCMGTEHAHGVPLQVARVRMLLPEP